MNKLIFTLLSLSTLCFAKEGDADALAGIVFAIIAYIVGTIIICYIGAAIMLLCDEIKKFWEKTNTFGKLICFGLPGTAITGTIFYFLIWFAIPFIIELVSEWPIVSSSITGGIYYISTVLTGWKNGDDTIKKRYGKYALFSRIFASLPILPIILVCWSIKNLFGILFIKNYRATNILGFWKIQERKNTFNENDWNENDWQNFFEKLP